MLVLETAIGINDTTILGGWGGVALLPNQTGYVED